MEFNPQYFLLFDFISLIKLILGMEVPQRTIVESDDE